MEPYGFGRLGASFWSTLFDKSPVSVEQFENPCNSVFRQQDERLRSRGHYGQQPGSFVLGPTDADIRGRYECSDGYCTFIQSKYDTYVQLLELVEPESAQLHFRWRLPSAAAQCAVTAGRP